MTHRPPWHIDAAAIAVMCALGGAGYCVGVAPLVRERARVRAVTDQVNAARAQSEKLLTAAHDLDASLSAMRDRLASSTLHLKPATFVNERIYELKRLALDCQLTLGDVQPGALEAGSLYRTTPITMTGTGSYAACAKFLHRLRTELPDTTLRVARIATGDAQTPPFFSFNLTWYAAPADRTASAGD